MPVSTKTSKKLFQQRNAPTVPTLKAGISGRETLKHDASERPHSARSGGGGSRQALYDDEDRPNSARIESSRPGRNLLQVDTDLSEFGVSAKPPRERERKRAGPFPATTLRDNTDAERFKKTFRSRWMSSQDKSVAKSHDTALRVRKEAKDSGAQKLTDDDRPRFTLNDMVPEQDDTNQGGSGCFVNLPFFESMFELKPNMNMPKNIPVPKGWTEEYAMKNAGSPAKERLRAKDRPRQPNRSEKNPMLMPTAGSAPMFRRVAIEEGSKTDLNAPPAASLQPSVPEVVVELEATEFSPRTPDMVSPIPKSESAITLRRAPLPRKPTTDEIYERMLHSRDTPRVGPGRESPFARPSSSYSQPLTTPPLSASKPTTARSTSSSEVKKTDLKLKVSFPRNPIHESETPKKVLVQDVSGGRITSASEKSRGEHSVVNEEGGDVGSEGHLGEVQAVKADPSYSSTIDTADIAQAETVNVEIGVTLPMDTGSVVDEGLRSEPQIALPDSAPGEGIEILEGKSEQLPAESQVAQSQAVANGETQDLQENDIQSPVSKESQDKVTARADTEEKEVREKQQGKAKKSVVIDDRSESRGRASLSRSSQAASTGDSRASNVDDESDGDRTITMEGTSFTVPSTPPEKEEADAVYEDGEKEIEESQVEHALSDMDEALKEGGQEGEEDGTHGEAEATNLEDERQKSIVDSIAEALVLSDAENREPRVSSEEKHQTGEAVFQSSLLGQVKIPTFDEEHPSLAASREPSLSNHSEDLDVLDSFIKFKQEESGAHEPMADFFTSTKTSTHEPLPFEKIGTTRSLPSGTSSPASTRATSLKSSSRPTSAKSSKKASTRPSSAVSMSSEKSVKSARESEVEEEEVPHSPSRSISQKSSSTRPSSARSKRTGSTRPGSARSTFSRPESAKSARSESARSEVSVSSEAKEPSASRSPTTRASTPVSIHTPPPSPGTVKRRIDEMMESVVEPSYIIRPYPGPRCMVSKQLFDGMSLFECLSTDEHMERDIELCDHIIHALEPDFRTDCYRELTENLDKVSFENSRIARDYVEYTSSVIADLIQMKAKPDDDILTNSQMIKRLPSFLPWADDQSYNEVKNNFEITIDLEKVTSTDDLTIAKDVFIRAVKTAAERAKVGVLILLKQEESAESARRKFRRQELVDKIEAEARKLASSIESRVDVNEANFDDLDIDLELKEEAIRDGVLESMYVHSDQFTGIMFGTCNAEKVQQALRYRLESMAKKAVHYLRTLGDLDFRAEEDDVEKLLENVEHDEKVEIFTAVEKVVAEYTSEINLRRDDLARKRELMEYEKAKRDAEERRAREQERLEKIKRQKQGKEEIPRPTTGLGQKMLSMTEEEMHRYICLEILEEILEDDFDKELIIRELGRVAEDTQSSAENKTEKGAASEEDRPPSELSDAFFGSQRDESSQGSNIPSKPTTRGTDRTGLDGVEEDQASTSEHDELEKSEEQEPGEPQPEEQETQKDDEGKEDAADAEEFQEESPEELATDTAEPVPSDMANEAADRAQQEVPEEVPEPSRKKSVKRSESQSLPKTQKLAVRRAETPIEEESNQSDLPRGSFQLVDKAVDNIEYDSCMQGAAEAMEIGDWKSAFLFFSQASNAESKRHEPWVGRADVFMKLGLFTTAVDDLRMAIDNCYNTEMLPQLYWKMAQANYKVQRREKAKECIAQILAMKPRHVDAILLRIEINVDSKRYKEAISDCEEVINNMDSNCDMAFYFRALCVQALQKNQMAAFNDMERAMKLALGQRRSNVKALQWLAGYHFGKQNYAKVVKDTTAVIKGIRTDIDVEHYLIRARALTYLEDYEAALKDLNEAITLDPNNGNVLYWRGCLLRDKYPENAIRDLTKALEFDPRNYRAYFVRGMILDKMGFYQLALDNYNQCLEINPKLLAVWINAGMIYLRRFHNYSETMHCCQVVLNTDRKYFKAIWLRAECYRFQGNMTAAIRVYTRLIHEDPTISEAYLHRGALLLEKRELHLALVDSLAYLDLQKGLQKSHEYRGNVLKHLSNPERASAEFAIAAKENPSLENQLDLAKMLEAKGDHEGSLTILLKCAKNNKESAPVHRSLAHCYLLMGDTDKSLDNYDRAIALDPKDAATYNLRGVCKKELNRGDKGFSDFTKCISLDNTITDAYFNLAHVHEGREEPFLAIHQYTRAIEVQPLSLTAFINRGVIQQRCGNFAHAINDYTEAARIDPGHALAFFNRGSAFHKIGMIDYAMQDYDKALRLDLDLVKARKNRGILYMSRGDYQTALADFKYSIGLTGNEPTTLCSIGVCQLKLGLLDDAIQVYTDAIALDPQLADAYVGRANVFFEKAVAARLQPDEWSACLEMCKKDNQRAIHIRPNMALAFVNLAYIHQLRGEEEQARTNFKIALAINPQEPLALEGVGVLNLARNRPNAAFMDISNAVSVAPNNAVILTNRGVVNQFLKDKHNALADYRKALEADPTYGHAHFNLANIFFQENKWKGARKHYDAAIKYNPKYALAWINRGVLRSKDGDLEGARSDLDEGLRLDPTCGNAYFNRGSVLKALGLLDLAEKDYFEALKLMPLDGLPYVYRGNVLGSLGVLQKEAMVCYSTALVLDEHINLS